MSDLRALIEAVEADTATGGRDALFVPADMSKLIERVIGDDDEMWSAFVAAHDGCLSEAVKVVAHLLPGWGWGIEQGEAAVWHPDTRGISRDISVSPVTSRALLLASLRAKMGEGE